MWSGSLRGVETQLRRNFNANVYPIREFRDKLVFGHHFLNAVMKQDNIFVLGNEYELRELLETPLDSRP